MVLASEKGGPNVTSQIDAVLESARPAMSIDPAVADAVFTDELPKYADGRDVLVVGRTGGAAQYVIELAARGAHVVLAAGGMDPAQLNPALANALKELERSRAVTLLFRSTPEQIGEVGGFPMAYFEDRRTPDLQFDFVVLTSLEDESNISNNVDDGIQDICASQRRRDFSPAIEELRSEFYNATITAFEPTHSDLWVLRVQPDNGEVGHLPGQYASLGLGYWEDRIDEVEELDIDSRWDKLVRRSYSISSPMMSTDGYLTNWRDAGELEFYIVLVPPSEGNIPGLTPRLALKCPGDRIYLGPKIAGRYTLAPITDPDMAVIFLSTGTGEAPHNAMIVELLQKGHTGPMLSAVSVRKWDDLGYIEKHRELERRFSNYTYLPMPTRESSVPKRYLQSLIADGDIETLIGRPLDSATTHVFLCGNPAMIGPPEQVGGVTRFPETTGVVELLVDRGFSVDARRSPGNVHFEEYW